MTPVRDEIRAVANLPGLAIEIVHRAPAPGEAETFGIRIRATPDLETAARGLGPALLPWAGLPMAPGAFDPFQFWLRMAEAAWRPWLALLGAPERKP